MLAGNLVSLRLFEYTISLLYKVRLKGQRNTNNKVLPSYEDTSKIFGMSRH